MRPIRVTHVVTRFILGGAQEATLLTAAHVDPVRFPSEIVSGVETGAEGDLSAEASARGIPLKFEPALVRRIDPRLDALALARLTARFRAERPDVVHTHSSKAGILGRAAARLAGVPVIVHTAHGWAFHRTQPWPVRAASWLMERGGAALCDSIPVVSQDTFDVAANSGLGPRAKFVVIRDPIELERYRRDEEARAAVRAEFGFAPRHFVFGFLSRLSVPKHPEVVVKAFARVAARPPDARLLIVGDGALRGETEQAIAETGTGERVKLAGLRRDVPRMLSAFDAFVLVSDWEGLPMVVPQAMAAGLPIVASAVGGTPDAVEEGVTGYLVPRGDFDTLVDRMDRLAADPEAARRMGAAGGPRLEPFSAPVVARRLEEIYEEVLVRKRGAAR